MCIKILPVFGILCADATPLNNHGNESEAASENSCHPPPQNNRTPATSIQNLMQSVDDALSHYIQEMYLNSSTSSLLRNPWIKDSAYMDKEPARTKHCFKHPKSHLILINKRGCWDDQYLGFGYHGHLFLFWYRDKFL